MRETLTLQLRRQRLEAVAKRFDTTLPQPVLSRVPTAQAPKASGYVSLLPKESTAIPVEPHSASGTARSEDHQSSDSVPVFVARDRRLGCGKNEVPDLQCEARPEKLSSKEEIRNATLDFVRAMQQRYSAVEVTQRRAASDAREAEGFEAALTFDLILEGPTKDPAPHQRTVRAPCRKGFPGHLCWGSVDCLSPMVLRCSGSLPPGQYTLRARGLADWCLLRAGACVGRRRGQATDAHCLRLGVNSLLLK
jgi:hypothetical protein